MLSLKLCVHVIITVICSLNSLITCVDMTLYVVAMCTCTHTFLDLRPGKADVKSKTLCAYKN